MSTTSTRSYDVNNNENGYDSNFVKLSLNKPKQWCWELTTSKSSPNIAFPRIQLYDSQTNNLLVEANEADCTYQGNDKLERHFINGVEIPLRVSHSRSQSWNTSVTSSTRKPPPPIVRSRSTSCKASVIEEAIVGQFVKHLTEQGIECNVRSRSVSRAPSAIKEQVPLIPLKKSKSAVEMPRVKKAPRSSSSVRFSTSFLQRLSERKDESSSDSEVDTPAQRYFYRSSNAGTLLLCDSDSMKKKRKRRSRNLDSLIEETEEHPEKQKISLSSSEEKLLASRQRRRRNYVQTSSPQDNKQAIVSINSKLPDTTVQPANNNNIGKKNFPLAIDELNSDEVLLHLVKRLANLKSHPNRCKDLQRDEYLLDDFELLNKLKYSATVADLSSNWIDQLNNNNTTRINNNNCNEGRSNIRRNVRNEISGNEIIMGSNASRYSGLSGRRAQSSGNLCNGSTTTTTPKKSNKKERKAAAAAATATAGKYGTTNNLNFSNIDDDTSSIATTTAAYDNASFTDPCIVNDISLQQLYSPYNGRKLGNGSPRPRQAYHGSLPNNLDTDEVDGTIVQRALINKYAKHDHKLLDMRYVTDSEQQGNQQGEHNITNNQQQPLPPYLLQQQNSPYNNSSSGKGSSISSNNLDNSSIKDQFYLPLQRNNNALTNTASDAGYDPGYASERSPEDELPPALPLIDEQQYLQNMQVAVAAHYNQQQQQPSAQMMMMVPYNYNNLSACLEYTQLYQYDFITKDTLFPVYIAKGPRGLGLSVSGGSDSNAPFPGLIRIKRLFPHQAAWSTGILQPGDIILAVNGVQLTGLTNYEALEILRTTPNEVYMIVSRPHDERYRKLSPPAEPPLPPLRTCGLEPLDPIQVNFVGEFEIFLTKQQGSLGFTLRKEDESVLGHCVRALVREPALSDGRIKPGDKIIAVNDIPISNMTHEQAVIFLRQAPDVVKLRLFRDESMTPLSAVSPTDSERKSLKRPILRPEAINLLTDIAHRKQNSIGDESTSSSQMSSNASPRRLRRMQKGTNSSQGSSNNPFIHTGSENTDSDTSTVVSQETSCRVQPVSSNSSIAFSQNGVISEPDEEEFYNEEELEAIDESYYGQRPNRPNYLDLVGQEGSTPVVSRKPQFQFSIANTNSYELNNLDNEVLDAPTIYTLSSTIPPGADEFTSLPCDTFLVSCKTETDLENCKEYVTKIARNTPSYQSAQYSSSVHSNETVGGGGGAGLDEKKDEGGKGLLKWKGIMLSPDKSIDDKTPSAESCNDITVISNTMTNSNSSLVFTTDSEGNQIFTIELNRGWNSRLGFSLTTDDNNQVFISAIYSDSVAARDGRLRIGDRILSVNDDSIDGMTKAQVIDLLRIIRGSIVLTIQRRAANNEQINEA